jgi:hypothetical protein
MFKKRKVVLSFYFDIFNYNYRPLIETYINQLHRIKNSFLQEGRIVVHAAACWKVTLYNFGKHAEQSYL